MEDTARREARALLIYLVTHHKYPALTNISALKALIDDAVCMDGLAEYHGYSGADRDNTAKRLEETEVWLKELLDMEKLLDAPMHFAPCSMAETLSLVAMVVPSKSGSDEEGQGTSQYAALARKFRWRAEQSYTMGRQHYHNLSRLIYLFDDLNDRRRHSVQAGQMNMADILALFRHILDERSA